MTNISQDLIHSSKSGQLSQTNHKEMEYIKMSFYLLKFSPIPEILQKHWKMLFKMMLCEKENLPFAQKREYLVLHS